MEEEQAGLAQQVRATSPQLEEVDHEEGETHDQETVSFTSPTSDSATLHSVSLAKAEQDRPSASWHCLTWDW